MIVDSLVHGGPVTIAADATAREAALLMRDRRVGCLVVESGGAPVGMVTERDLAFRVVADARDPAQVRVREIMSSPLATIEPTATVEEAAARMKALRVKRLAVVLEGRLRGLVTVTDIAYAEPEINRRLVEGWVKQRWEG